EEIPTAPLASLPAALAGLVKRATSKDTASRPRDFGEVLQILGKVSPSVAAQRGAATRTRAAMASVAALLLIGGGAVLVSVKKRQAGASTATPPLVAAMAPSPKPAAEHPAGPTSPSKALDIQTEQKNTPPQAPKEARPTVVTSEREIPPKAREHR